MSKQNETVFAFIDSQNLHLGVKDQGWTLDFNKFHKYLQDKYGVSKSFLFIGYIHRNENLYIKLKLYGYTLIFKSVLIYKKEEHSKIKGNVDAELVLHTMIEFPNYDKVIITSGDGDFHCLLEYLEQKHKLKRLFIPNRKQFSALLRKFYQKMVFTDEIRNKVQKKRRAVPRHL